MGSSNVDASITLQQDFMPQAYALDPRLAEVRAGGGCGVGILEASACVACLTSLLTR